MTALEAPTTATIGTTQAAQLLSTSREILGNYATKGLCGTFPGGHLNRQWTLHDVLRARVLVIANQAQLQQVLKHAAAWAAGAAPAQLLTEADIPVGPRHHLRIDLTLTGWDRDIHAWIAAEGLPDVDTAALPEPEPEPEPPAPINQGDLERIDIICRRLDRCSNDHRLPTEERLRLKAEAAALAAALTHLAR